MKYVILILFCIFVFQSDTTKVDTIVVQQAYAIQKNFNNMSNKLDSIIAVLEQDTIKNKKH